MKNYLIYVISSFFLSFVLVFVLVLPAYNNLNDLNSQVFEKEISLQSQQEYFWELEDIAKRIEGQEDSLIKIRSAIPDGSDLANLMNYFQRSASKAGVSMESISPALIASATRHFEDIKLHHQGYPESTEESYLDSIFGTIFNLMGLAHAELNLKDGKED